LIKRCLYYLAALLIVLGTFWALCFFYNESRNILINIGIKDVKAGELFIELARIFYFPLVAVLGFKLGI
jgi:hypothetical protein